MDIKQETIEMLRVLKGSAISTTLDGKEAVVLEDIKMDSFMWVINQAISQIKDESQIGGICNDSKTKSL